ncbi:AraC family transcriptional regulator [Paenibacillus flagellatus]|nr:AraC family transcriptional regulator [Paenibacillus flagellatus]
MTRFPMTRNLYSTESCFNISPYFPFHIVVAALTQKFPVHRHDFLELSLVIEGEGRQVINGVTYPMAPGTCTFLLPFQVHEIVPGPSKPLRLYNCMFDSDFLFQSSGAGLGLKDLLFPQEKWVPSVRFTAELYEFVKSLMHGMLTEFVGGELWRDELLRIKLSEVLIRFDRQRRSESTADPAKTGGSAHADSIWSVIHYMQTHYQEPITLSGLADVFELNSSCLSADLKRHTGLNFVRLLHEFRVRHACSLLACTDMNVFDIAFEVGFGSYPSFLRIFRELKGVAPGEYRKRFQTNTNTIAT